MRFVLLVLLFAVGCSDRARLTERERELSDCRQARASAETEAASLRMQLKEATTPTPISDKDIIAARFDEEAHRNLGLWLHYTKQSAGDVLDEHGDIRDVHHFAAALKNSAKKRAGDRAYLLLLQYFSSDVAAAIWNDKL